MHQASPVRGCRACRIRYRVGSRRLMLPDAMSIFARSPRAPLGNSPARMRRNRSRFSSTEDRKSVGLGKSVSVRVNLGGGRFIKKKKHIKYPYQILSKHNLNITMLTLSLSHYQQQIQ